jgi:hypothetical protein
MDDSKRIRTVVPWSVGGHAGCQGLDNPFVYVSGGGLGSGITGMAGITGILGSHHVPRELETGSDVQIEK